HAAQKNAVSLVFTGQGKRPVRVGYVVEAPVWKTSYRLALPPAGGEGKPRLQGWAVVENTTDEDWQGVRVALISGRPISFKMDLYQPLYVPRPTVEPQLFASLRPVAYSGALKGARPESNMPAKTEPRGDRDESKALGDLEKAPAGANGRRGFGLDRDK